MTISYFFTFLILAILLTGIIIAGGVSAFDIRAIRYEKLFKQHPYTRRFRLRPLISVIIDASDDLDSIQRCLDSIVRNKYRNTEVIIIDRLPHSQLRHHIRTYSTLHPHFKVSIFKTKRYFDSVITPAYRRYGAGEIILSIDSKSYIDIHTLHRLNYHFLINEKINIIALNHQIIITPSLKSIFMGYILFLGNLLKKANSTLGYMSQNGYINSAIRKEILLNKRRASRQNITYSDNTLIYFKADSIIKQLTAKTPNQSPDYRHTGARSKWTLSIFMTLLQVSFILLLGYIIYLAFILHQPTLFIISLVIISVALFFAIWSDRHIPRWHKISYSLLIPTTYLPTYLMVFLSPLISLRSIFRFYTKNEHP